MNKYIINVVNVGVKAYSIEQAILKAQKAGFGVSEANFTLVKDFPKEVKKVL